MLQTNDVGRLFAIMQASYGSKWTHTGDHIPIWQDALKGFKAEDVFIAAKKSIKTYPNFPPSAPILRNLARTAQTTQNCAFPQASAARYTAPKRIYKEI